MLCKSKASNKKFAVGMTLLGVIGIVFGVVMVSGLPEGAHSLNMLAGLITGMGAAFAVMGALALFQMKFRKEKVRQQEIEANDERNIQILRASYTIAAIVSLLLFIIMGITFLILDMIVAALIAICGVYIEAFVIVISYDILKKKM